MAYDIEKSKKALKNGVDYWNKWRVNQSQEILSLRGLNFHHEFPCEEEAYNTPFFEDADFTHLDMNGVELRNGTYVNCRFDYSNIHFADLVDTFFSHCSFVNTSMAVCKIGSARFINCHFENTDLGYCSAEETDFSGSQFIGCRLEHMSFVSSNFSDTKLVDCRVYGISSWDIILQNSTQQNLIITHKDQPEITVDNIELAQFMYLMINNSRLRHIIDTITAKVVLILGNFAPQRKAILDQIREELRYYNLIPVMFDFDKPTSRNFTETVVTLAHMAKFIIADLSSTRSIGHELASIVPKLPSVPCYPLVVKDDKEYGMFSDLETYQWVRPVVIYDEDSINAVIKDIAYNEMSIVRE